MPRPLFLPSQLALATFRLRSTGAVLCLVGLRSASTHPYALGATPPRPAKAPAGCAALPRPQ
eukprot:3787201-Lingulodinium_polyedra.AAC.1